MSTEHAGTASTEWLGEGEIRSLAVEIVDTIHGYTCEFAGSPAAHEHDYDWVEARITDALAGLESGSSETTP